MGVKVLDEPSPGDKCVAVKDTLLGFGGKLGALQGADLDIVKTTEDAEVRQVEVVFVRGRVWNGVRAIGDLYVQATIERYV